MTTEIEQRLVVSVGLLTEIVKDIQFYGNEGIDKEKYIYRLESINDNLSKCVFSDDMIIPEHIRTIIVNGVKFSRDLFSSIADKMWVGRKFEIVKNENQIVTIMEVKE